VGRAVHSLRSESCGGTGCPIDATYEVGRALCPGAEFGIEDASSRSAVASAWMISRTASEQPPQQAPAPHACATWLAVLAPRRITLRMVRSEIPLQ
jgi:hypothetical protein